MVNKLRPVANGQLWCSRVAYSIQPLEHNT